MHLDSIVHFRKLEPKKKYRYTWVRFDRGKHYDLIDKKARVYDIGGNLLIVPMKDEFCTSQSESGSGSEIEILNTVKSEIEGYIGVQNQKSANIDLNGDLMSAKGRIRTGEPLQERILSPSPLAGLGYLRADTLFDVR